MAAKYAPPAVHEIENALSEESVETPSPLVSCGAVLARKMGAADVGDHAAYLRDGGCADIIEALANA